MTRLLAAGLCTTALLSGAFLAAQEGRLPSEPAGKFGHSVTGAYDGWFHNPDGTESFLVGYYNRNTEEALDVPIGPNNRIEPGGPDLGQPTHFLPGRNIGMFTVAVPKGFTPQQSLTWTLVVNGQTTSIPLRMKVDYYVSPFGSDIVGNRPPVIRFAEHGPTITGPTAHTTRAISRQARVSTPLALSIWADDDAGYSSGTNAPMRNPPPPVVITWTKFRGAGPVVFENPRPHLEVFTGGKVGQPFSGRGATTATFSAPGEYILLASVTDYSGAGGNGEVCCWTTALVKVTVTP